MNNSTKIILAFSFLCSLGFAALAQNVYAKRQQPQIAVIKEQHSSITQAAEVNNATKALKSTKQIKLAATSETRSNVKELRVGDGNLVSQANERINDDDENNDGGKK